MSAKLTGCKNGAVKMVSMMRNKLQSQPFQRVEISQSKYMQYSRSGQSMRQV